MKAFLVILLAFSLVSVCGGYKLPASQVYGELSMVNHKITDLSTPTEDTDAATKAYADSVAIGGGLPTTGGAMTGQIDFGNITGYNIGTPVNDSDVSTKEYVDDAVSSMSDYVSTAQAFNNSAAQIVVYCNDSTWHARYTNNATDISTGSNASIVVQAAIDSIPPIVGGYIAVRDPISLPVPVILDCTNTTLDFKSRVVAGEGFINITGDYNELKFAFLDGVDKSSTGISLYCDRSIVECVRVTSFDLAFLVRGDFNSVTGVSIADVTNGIWFSDSQGSRVFFSELNGVDVAPGSEDGDGVLISPAFSTDQVAENRIDIATIWQFARGVVIDQTIGGSPVWAEGNQIKTGVYVCSEDGLFINETSVIDGSYTYFEGSVDCAGSGGNDITDLGSYNIFNLCFMRPDYSNFDNTSLYVSATGHQKIPVNTDYSATPHLGEIAYVTATDRLYIFGANGWKYAQFA